MLRRTITDETTYPAYYIPVPRKDEMSEAHVEDYLDHFSAPLVGKVSYEERSKMREELRAQIESIVAAYVELGSSREQAIALALQQFSHVPSVTPERTMACVSVEHAIETPKVKKSDRRLALKYFGVSTAASFVTFMSMGESPGAGPMMAVLLAGLPFLAGVGLGYRKQDRPLRSMLKTIGWLSLPMLAMSWIFTSANTHSDPFSTGVAVALSWLAGSCLFGGAGVKLGIWMRITGFMDKIDPPAPARLENGPHRLP